jgi:hypothetical protein
MSFNDDEPIQVHHASFRDVLDSQERSSLFYAGSSQHRARLVCSILKATFRASRILHGCPFDHQEVGSSPRTFSIVSIRTFPGGSSFISCASRQSS